MQQTRRFLVAALAFGLSSMLPAFAQDEPSLGDAARLARQQKQQKEAQTKDSASKDAANKSSNAKDAQPAKTTKVITNEELPEHTAPISRPAVTTTGYHQSEERGSQEAEGAAGNAEAVKAQITQMKGSISGLQSQIDSLNDSIHFAPGNCVANCAQWNERQVEKQQQVEQMKAQLEDMKKQLEDMQETARKQGYGSSVYDP